MKILTTIISFTFISIFAVNCETSDNKYEPQKDTFHFYECVLEGCPWKFKFRDVFEETGLLREFPSNWVEELFDASINKEFNLDYWIYSSITDAEMAVVELKSRSNEPLVNMIDYPLEDGMIGHNCWHSLEFTGKIIFIRYNAVVTIKPQNPRDFEPEAVENIARKVDSVLIHMPRIEDKDRIPFPVVSSLSLVSDPPLNVEDGIKILLEAFDVKGRKCYCRRYGYGYFERAIYVECGDTISVGLSKKMDSTEDPNILKVKFWVWNTDHYVNSVEKYVRLEGVQE